MSLLSQFREWNENSKQVLSINNRNLGYIYSYNERRHFNLADDKVLAKKVLSEVGVPVPDTYLLVDSFYHVNRIDPHLEKLDDYVIKPAQGRGGGGIVVITGKHKSGWCTASGKIKSNEDIKRHVADIVFGNHSFDKSDVAIFEQRLIPAELLHELSPWGLPDVRIIAFKNKLMMAMCRVPTKDSGGRANIHQGAVAMGLDLDTGVSTHALFKNRLINNHPDHGKNLIGLRLPFWNDVIDMARLCAQTLPLKYLGVDIAISIDGPKILEVNARPGLAIQLANDRGLQPLLLAGLDE
jgi:alpha-L-glutamate ligase-like protein